MPAISAAVTPAAAAAAGDRSAALPTKLMRPSRTATRLATLCFAAVVVQQCAAGKAQPTPFEFTIESIEIDEDDSRTRELAHGTG